MQIASFATFFYLLSYQVDGHCFYPDGSFDHAALGCRPTISPAPTESPAPSPSPSVVPTDTQAPSHSMLPSFSPTPAPTTSEPSDAPSDPPTESPAPSPSPSGIPSALPTKSAAPSMSPTDLPSEFPSQNPSFSPTTSSPSDSPTGPILLTVVDVEFSIQNVTGEREMSPQNIKYFEKEMALYLRDQIQQAPGVFKIEVENVLVKDQNLVVQDNGNSLSENEPLLHDPFLRRRRRLEESQTHLIITLDVVVSVVLNQSENPKLKEFFTEFFEMPEHENELRGILEQEKSFFQELFIKGPISSSKASVKKASNGTSVTGTVLGLVALIVGSGLLWMWIKTRQSGVRQSNDSGKIRNLDTISRSFESDDRRGAVSSAGRTREIDSADTKRLKTTRNDQFVDTDYIDNEYDKDDQSSSQLMYIRTIMRTESNIEVPDTPATAFAVNGFATPSSVNRFMTVPDTPATAFAVNGFATPASANGFMTPASTKSKGVIDNSPVVLPKLLGETSPNHTLSSAKILKDIDLSRKQKIHLPPKILGPLKSPFRREIKVGDKVSRDLPPLVIGGPGVEENLVSRPHTRRQNKKYSRAPRPCPPMVIGGPPDASLSVANSTKTKDNGVIDIVDEIAYLYSTKSEPDRYQDASLNN